MLLGHQPSVPSARLPGKGWAGGPAQIHDWNDASSVVAPEGICRF